VSQQNFSERSRKSEFIGVPTYVRPNNTPGPEFLDHPQNFCLTEYRFQNFWNMGICFLKPKTPIPEFPDCAQTLYATQSTLIQNIWKSRRIAARPKTPMIPEFLENAQNPCLTGSPDPEIFEACTESLSRLNHRIENIWKSRRHSVAQW
jgi:hypothetical protein